jgi:outer membrane protein OmpU
MKKTLLATSALAGVAFLTAGAASAGPVGSSDTMTVKMNGYQVFQAATLDSDSSLSRGRGYRFSQPEGEFGFTASAKTESGITYGFRTEIGTEAISADELYGFISGDFGKVEFGNQDGAANQMQVGSFNANGTFQGNLGGTFGLSAFNGQAGASDVHLVRDDIEQVIYGDGNKIVYISPRFSGFQIGASWTPQSNAEGSSGFGDNAVSQFNNIGFENVGDIAVNYVGSFNDVSLKASAAYIFSDDQETSAGVAMEDLGVTKLGAAVSFSGLTVGVSYRHNGDYEVALNGLGDGGKWMGIGAMYKMGAWTFNASAARGKQDFGEALLEQTNNKFGLGVGYAVAPGWDLMGDYINLSRENNNGAATPAVGDDASAFIISNRFKF